MSEQLHVSMQMNCSTADFSEELQALKQAWYEVGNSSALAETNSSEVTSHAPSIHRLNVHLYLSVAIAVLFSVS
jgi:hypothetical protein